MGRRAVWAIALGCAVVVACGRAPHAGPAPRRDLVLRSDDGAELYATLYPAGDGHSPGLVLVPQKGGSRAEWDAFARAAQRAGYVCLAVDLRGHGESTGPGGRQADWRAFTVEDWSAAQRDIDAALRALPGEGADAGNLGVAGADLGANLALRYAAGHPDVQAVVLVSPGLDYGGVTTEDAMERYGVRPSLLVTARNDAYAVSSCDRLKEVAPGQCELREYAGTAHGVALFSVSENATVQVLGWLDEVLKGARPPRGAGQGPG